MTRMPDYATCVRCNKSFWLDDLNADRICIYCHVKQRRKVVQIVVTDTPPKSGCYPGCTTITRLYDDGDVVMTSRNWGANEDWIHEVVPDIPREGVK